ncbi:MAG: hypothetical protein Q9166_002976 [cf. Caloplaca sp. 2 TL-2023]
MPFQVYVTSKRSFDQQFTNSIKCECLEARNDTRQSRLNDYRISTAQKLLKASASLSASHLESQEGNLITCSGDVLNIPVYVTTQNAARLGSICSELSLPSSAFQADKTAFSMMVPSLRSALASASSSPFQIAIVGIESHICVTQTALDLLAEGHRVYVLADGVSSCNEGERGVALRRLQGEGAVVTTSEGWLYECMGDASIGEFKAIAGLVKETKESTKDAVQTLCKM